MRSANRLPAALWLPKLPLRHRTPGGSARSAALLVGSTPGIRTNVQRAGARARISRYVAAVGAWRPRLPSQSRASPRRPGGLGEGGEVAPEVRPAELPSPERPAGVGGPPIAGQDAREGPQERL